MAARKSKGAKKPVKKPVKKPAKKTVTKKSANELVCNDCGMIVIVEDQCGCGCTPTCCGSPMVAKK